MCIAPRRKRFLLLERRRRRTDGHAMSLLEIVFVRSRSIIDIHTHTHTHFQGGERKKIGHISLLLIDRE